MAGVPHVAIFTKMNISFKDSVRTGSWIIVILSAIGLLAILSGLTDTHEMMFQTVIVLLSVIVTAIITGALLERQTTGEEQREKSVQIHTNKITAYSEFVSKMWSSLDGEIIDRRQIECLRAEMFNKLIFYFDNSVIDSISAKLGELRENLDVIDINSDDESNDKKAARYRRIFADITAILRNDVSPNRRGGDPNDDSANIRNLWSIIDSFINDGTEVCLNGSGYDAGGNAESGAEQLKNRCFQFNAWGWEYHKSLWSDVKGNLYPLFMCEYGGERWRTEFLKNRIRENDLIFLYRPGGSGYVGISRAKGYVTLEFGSEQKDILCRMHSYETGQTQELNYGQMNMQAPEHLHKLMEVYEEYKAENISSENEKAYYSYLYVEPVLLYPDGVGADGTRRHTISPFDSHSAWVTLMRFKRLVDDGRIANENIDRKLFDEILVGNGIAVAANG